jgi:hypothetical protein
LECVCRESLALTASEAVCRCGADHTGLVREERASDGERTPEMRSTTSSGRSETNTFGWSISRLAKVEGHRVVEKEEDWEPSWLPSGRSGSVHYVIARRETTGFELPHTFFHLGKEVMPVFSSAEAARRFLASLALGDRWHVREFSTGELGSLLFILHKRVAWVLPNPPLKRLLAEDALSQLMRRDSFVEFLIAN